MAWTNFQATLLCYPIAKSYYHFWSILSRPNSKTCGYVSLAISSTYHHHPLGSSLDYSRSLRLLLPIRSRTILSFCIASTPLSCHGRRPPSRRPPHLPGPSPTNRPPSAQRPPHPPLRR